ncbi:MAG: VanW family protein [Anaerolineales bacterium]
MQPSTAYPTRPQAPVTPGVPITVWLARVALSALFMAVIAFAAALMVAAAFGLRYQGKVYPGVSAWGVDLSGQSPAAAAASLTGAFTYPSRPAFIFRDGDPQSTRIWSATPAQLGLRYDLGATVGAAYNIGRSGNLVVDAFDMLRAWYGGRQVSPVVIYDQAQPEAFLAAIAPEVYRPTTEATLQADGVNITTTPGSIGRQLDVLATAAAVRPALLGLRGADVTLIYIETPPLVLDASAQAAAAQAIVREPLTLSIAQPQAGDPGPWVLDQAALGAMLEVRRVPDSANAAHYEVGLNGNALRAYLQPLGEPLEQTPNNARFTFNTDTNQLDRISDSRAGRHLDIDASMAAISQALAAGTHAVPLVFTITPPAVPDDATAAQLGITQLVSEQSTYFLGSSAERVRNIEVAGARFHGLLVPPNSDFSFDDNLGDVSLDSGFAEALIIFGGRTIRGVGGGVCQVSTTIFRAAYFGGFPIVERYSHAYRVGYYERGDTWKGPGLDATVYSPLVDFKFTNDTPYWLLMEVYVNPASSRITWKFYSTSDGRSTTVSAANVQNVVPAPEPLYEEDATLAAGQIKQVDYAADGADVSISRVIMRDGAQINANEAPLTTHYQPWRAVFDYGPGTEGIPTPEPTPTP